MADNINDSKANLLIVEDEVVIAADLESRLKSIGYTIIGMATSADKALELVDKHRPDLIMMDIVLQGEMDGIEAAEAIRDKWGIPVIFLTAYADTERLERAKLTYPFGYILKPFQDRDLKITLDMALYAAKVDSKRRRAEEELNRIFLLNPGMICVAHADGYFKRVNPAFERTLGYTTEEILSKPFMDFIHPDDRESTIAEVSKQVAGMPTIDFVNRYICKDGSIKWLEWIATPAGEDGHLYAAARDITDRKKAEESLLESEEKYRQVVSKTMDAIMLFDSETRRFIDVNEACIELYGYSREEFLAMKQSDITAEPEKSDETIKLAISGEIGRIPVRYHRKKDGAIFPVQISASAFVQKGRVALCGIVRDITSIKRDEEELRQSEEKFRCLIEGSIQGILIHRAYEPLFANEAWASIHGYTLEEILNMDSVIPLISPQDQKRMIEYNTVRMRGDDAPVRYEYQGVRKDGSLIWLENRVMMVQWNEEPAIQSIIVDITDRKQAEENLQQHMYELDERVKELNCLYGISKLVETPGITLEEILQGTVDLIPASWRCPDITCARLTINGVEFKTANYRDCETKQVSDIYLHRERVGLLEVAYLEKRPEIFEGPFLQEERMLIDAITGRLGRIIQRYKNEELLRCSEEKYRGIVDDLPGFICTFDRNFIIKFVNTNYCREFYMRSEELIGNTFLNLIPESDRKYVIENISSLNLESPVNTLEHRVVSDKNGIRWQRWTNRAIFDNEGRFIEYQSVGEDITSLKMAEHAKQKAYNELERRVEERTQELMIANQELQIEVEDRKHAEAELKKSNEDIRNFAYSVLHDLKNPAISAYGLTKLLTRKNETILDETSLRYCDQMLKATEQIASLIEMVNQYISTKENPLKIEKVDLKELILMIKDEFSTQINLGRIEWLVPDSLPEINADRMSLVRVLRNLVDNALKYGGDLLTGIEFGCSESGDAYIFSVRDDGEGIKGEDSKDIFSLFQRDAQSNKVEGSGIGLAVVKEIAKQHNGAVWLESGQTRGTTFYFSISKNLGQD